MSNDDADKGAAKAAFNEAAPRNGHLTRAFNRAASAGFPVNRCKLNPDILRDQPGQKNVPRGSMKGIRRAVDRAVREEGMGRDSGDDQTKTNEKLTDIFNNTNRKNKEIER